MTEQERIIQQHMDILALEDEVLTLRAALRESLNYAQETSIRLSRLEAGDVQGAALFIQETISRGLRLNENYRGLLDNDRPR